MVLVVRSCLKVSRHHQLVAGASSAVGCFWSVFPSPELALFPAFGVGCLLQIGIVVSFLFRRVLALVSRFWPPRQRFDGGFGRWRRRCVGLDF
jgi:hypothetical protein